MMSRIISTARVFVARYALMSARNGSVFVIGYVIISVVVAVMNTVMIAGSADYIFCTAHNPAGNIFRALHNAADYIFRSSYNAGAVSAAGNSRRAARQRISRKSRK
jgi:hypothetical protein